MHRLGVGSLLYKKYVKSCLVWDGIDNKMLVAHFMTKNCRVVVIAVFAPVELTDGVSSDSDKFYVLLNERMDRVPGRNMVFLFGDING